MYPRVETTMNTLYEQPWNINSLDDCAFYHTIDLPGFGTQYGSWDLREGIDQYLPPINYSNQRVLEIGTANGFVCFELERRGAEVIAFDLAEGLSYDIVPQYNADLEQAIKMQSEGVKKVKNAFWFAHSLFNSHAKVLYGHANDVPDELGNVDIAFLGNVLQHLKDPFGAVISAGMKANQIAVTEANWNLALDPNEPQMYFFPNPNDAEEPYRKLFSWWQVTPGLVRRWFKVLGFKTVQQYEHEQYFCEIDKYIPHFTVVGKRD